MLSRSLSASPRKKQPKFPPPTAFDACRVIRSTVVKGISMFEIHFRSIGRLGSLKVEAIEIRSPKCREARSQYRVNKSIDAVFSHPPIPANQRGELKW